MSDSQFSERLDTLEKKVAELESGEGIVKSYKEFIKQATAIEKILARTSGRDVVRPGEVAVCRPDIVLHIDLPMAIGLIKFSTRLLSAGRWPPSMNRVSASQRFKL